MKIYCEIERILVWFSCGATSAVAAKLAIKKYGRSHPVDIVYTDTGSEHPDNERFLKDCEEWFGRPVKVIKNPQYKNIWDVFRKTRYLVGPTGARCTAELKKKMRHQYQQIWSDLQVFGFHVGERQRAARFIENNPEAMLWTPLIDEGLGHDDCVAMIKEAGIEVPAMYLLGYQNNNCIGCVKGYKGYWAKIRQDFPEYFSRMIEIEAELGNTVLREDGGAPLRLKDLPSDIKPLDDNPEISCGVLCETVLEDIEIQEQPSGPVIRQRADE